MLRDYKLNALEWKYLLVKTVIDWLNCTLRQLASLPLHHKPRLSRFCFFLQKAHPHVSLIIFLFVKISSNIIIDAKSNFIFLLKPLQRCKANKLLDKPEKFSIDCKTCMHVQKENYFAFTANAFSWRCHWKLPCVRSVISGFFFEKRERVFNSV